MQEAKERLVQRTGMPPEDVAAEEAIIGGILNDAMAIARIQQKLEPCDFFSASHQKIYEAILYFMIRAIILIVCLWRVG